MAKHERDDETGGVTRRKLMACAPWAGAGVVWGLAGGIPYAVGLLGEAQAQTAGALTFVQISDSHIGFAKPVNPDPRGTLTEVVGRIAAMPSKPAFMIHTGDITHLSHPREFDDAAQIISGAGLATRFVPGEHDLLDPEMSMYRERYGAGAKGAGWYSFDVGGVHFIALVNVDMSGRDLGEVYIDDPGPKAGGLGVLGEDQLAWIADDLRGRAASTPIVVMAHVPLWAAYPTWGWGTQDGARALTLLRRFGSVTVLNGHIHQVLQKVEGNVAFHTAMSTAFPQPAPGSAPKPGPKKIAANRLRSVLGATTVSFHAGQRRLALVDATLES
ncbi:MAG TPA: metallophosphoesterase [Caulobacteraceae bacterium]|nr:metallophosphoesterase [Caulobacteraceae bacterium]